MSDLILNYSTLQSKSVKFHVTGSKSISQRALIINTLMNFDGEIRNLSKSNDTVVLYKALTSSNNIVDVSNSGTALRFLLSFFALQNKEILINGDDYLFTRPINLLIDILNSIGANIVSVNNSVIIKKGSLIGGDVYFDSIKTSQFVSSLLLIAPYLDGGLRLHLPEKIYSQSYINMTTSMLLMCGIGVDYSNNTISVREGFYQQPYHTVESDWTSVSYLYLAFLFSKLDEIIISSFEKNTIQGDVHVIDFFALLGVRTKYKDNCLILTKIEDNTIPKKIVCNFSESPDLCPTIFIACVGLNIKLEATGVKNLQYKESNRIISMKTELEKFNCRFDVMSEDVVLIDSTKRINSENIISIETHNDHRIALAFSPLALLGFKLKIQNSNVIKKSYPDFFNDLIKFGVLIEKTI